MRVKNDICCFAEKSQRNWEPQADPTKFPFCHHRFFSRYPLLRLCWFGLKTSRAWMGYIILLVVWCGYMSSKSSSTLHRWRVCVIWSLWLFSIVIRFNSWQSPVGRQLHPWKDRREQSSALVGRPTATFASGMPKVSVVLRWICYNDRRGLQSGMWTHVV